MGLQLWDRPSLFVACPPAVFAGAFAVPYIPMPGLFLPRCPLSECGGVSRDCLTYEFLEGSFVDLLPVAEVDRTPRVPFQTGIEKLLRVFERGPAKERELHDLFVRFSCADAAVMRN